MEINEDNLPPSELLDALITAYQLSGEPHDIEVFPDRDHVLGFTVGSQRYIAQTGYNWSDEDVQFKIGLQQYLHGIGYPIPAIYLTRDGEVVWDIDGIGAVLTEYVGLPYDPSRKREQCDAAATAQGWFHREASKAPGLGTCYWDEDAGFEYSLAFNENARGFLAKKSLSMSSRQQVTDCIDEMEEILHTARSILVSEDWFELPHVPVHGEYCQYHCRYAGDKVVGVIDWDTARLAPRIQDVARALDIGLGWGAVEDYDSFQWQRTEIPEVADVVHWVDCYRETAPPFSRKELELFPYACAAMWPTAGGSQVPGTEARVADCDRVVQFMRFWLDEAAVIQEALMQLVPVR